MAAFGLKPEAPLAPDTTDLWPEHWPAVRLFVSASTQWRVSHNGAIGLCYEALPVLRDAHGITPADWPQVLADLQVLERQALGIWREQSARRKG